MGRTAESGCDDDKDPGHERIETPGNCAVRQGVVPEAAGAGGAVGRRRAGIEGHVHRVSREHGPKKRKLRGQNVVDGTAAGVSALAFWATG